MTSSDDKAFQDDDAEDVAHCFGCGRLNEHGHHIRTFWDGDESVSRFLPKPYHTAVPGFVYGGLIASLIDCHGTGIAAAAAHRMEGRAMPNMSAMTFCPTPCRRSSAPRSRPADAPRELPHVAPLLACRGL